MDLEPVCSVSVPLKQTHNWKLCLICNKHSKMDLSKATQSGLDRFKESFDIRRNHNDLSWGNLFQRITTMDDVQEKTILWHKNCYASFTSRENIKKVEKRSATKSAEQSDVLQVQPPLDERMSRSTTSINMDMCILCQKRKTLQRHEENLVLVQTYTVAEKIREIAKCDSTVNCRLGTLDPIAAEVMYHRSCLKKHCLQDIDTSKSKNVSLYDQAFEQLLQTINEGFAIGQVYLLNTLSEVFNNILLSMGVEDPRYPKKLLLKRIIEHYGDRIDTASSSRRNESTYIFPKITVAEAIQQLQNLCQEHGENPPTQTNVREMEDDQFMNRIFYHVSQKIKNDLKASKGLHNITELTKKAAKQLVPESLQILLNLILGDSDKNPDVVENKVISLGQDIVYACNNRNLTPKHIGIGLAIHQATRSRSLVDLVHAAGNCISYNTLLRVDTSLANHLLKTFEDNRKVFIPENLCHTQNGQHFTHFATDNIDILEETIDGRGTFHGTQLVAFQRGPSKSIDAEVALGRSDALHDIPHELLKVDPVPDIGKPAIKVPAEIKKNDFAESQRKNPINSRDIIWLTCRFANKGQVIPSWTDINKILTQSSHHITTVGYTPILNHPAHETDTLVAVLNRCKDITKALGQKHTVLTCDEALYCKIKQIQWYTDNYNDVTVRLGGFHWVLNFLRIIGQHFGSSGLSDVWVESGIYGESTAQSIVDGRHYNRAVRALKLTTDALWRVLFHNIKEWACEKGVFPAEILTQIESLGDCNEPSLELICKWDDLDKKADIITNLVKEFDKENEANQMFIFWRSYLDMAGLVLNFIRAEREGNWSMHLETVAQMLPWFFVYDHTNYARWGTIYLVDMQALSETANEVYIQFMNGNFVVKETGNAFNEKSPDQALEHINKIHKIAGGLVGITRNDTARDRWCLTFNYRSHLSEKARTLFGVQHNEACDRKTFTTNLQKDEADVQKLVQSFKKIKLFDQTNTTLSNIFTGEIASGEIAKDLLSARSRGLKLSEDFLTERVIEKQIDFYSPLKKVKSKTFKHLHVANVAGKSGKKVNTVDTNILVRHMFSAIKSGRQIDLKIIMKNELRDPPPSLFDINGLIRHTPKAILCNLIADQSTFENITNEANMKTATLIDGQALVQSNGKPKGAKTFGDLSDVFVRSVCYNFKSNDSQSVHVLFDRYIKNSTKIGTREMRRQSVIPIEHQITGRETLLPLKWNRFIHSTENKARLSDFLSKEIAIRASKLPTTQELLTSGGYLDAEQVCTNVKRNVDHLRSTQEEADTRFILHGIDCKQSGFERVIVNCRDTDVLLLILHFYELLPSVVWLKSGTNKKPKFIAVKNIRDNMTNDKRKSLLGYHSLTGCDTTSAMSGHTKKSSWPIYQKHYQLLSNFGTSPQITEEQISHAERFVILMYTNKKPGLQEIDNLDNLRAAMFQNIKELDKLPPTRQAFRQHALRANYQAFCWQNADVAKPTLPEPIDCGWKIEDNGVLVPVTSSVNSISLKDLELISCQCKAGCRSSRCGCSAKKQKCIDGICHVGFKCFNQFNYVDDTDQNDDAD